MTQAPTRNFDLALISRLRFRHPDVDIDRIADEIAADPEIRNVNAMLTARVRRADADSQQRSAETQKQADSPPGGFWPDGCWNPKGNGTDYLTRFVWMLCTSRRRNPGFSPADAQRIVDSKGLAAAFDPFDAVANPDSPASWSGVSCSRSSTQAVKHMGHGGYGYWSEDSPGQWLPKN